MTSIFLLNNLKQLNLTYNSLNSDEGCGTALGDLVISYCYPEEGSRLKNMDRPERKSAIAGKN
jgi:hypothetical protein